MVEVFLGCPLSRLLAALVCGKTFLVFCCCHVEGRNAIGTGQGRGGKDEYGIACFKNLSESLIGIEELKTTGRNEYEQNKINQQK